LILVEGIPGSGKTTTAVFVADWLHKHRIETAVFLEGNLDHPADFESVACLDEQEYMNLLTLFPAQADFLQSQVIQDGADYFFRYRALQQNHSHLPETVINALAQYEIYELPAPKFQRLMLRRWQQFAASAASENVTYIFECCFLQNPLTLMLGRHDEPVAEANTFILELANSVQALQPRWLYLNPGNVRTTLTKVAQTRPPEWLDFVIAYHTQQGHGKAQGWQGFDGMVRFYEMRQAIELALLPQLPFPGLLVQHTNWKADQKQIEHFLTQTFLS
jgi:hypothetical protein